MGDADPATRQRRVARLLGRGGQALGLAATAHARGQRGGRGPWYVLAPETIAAAEQVLVALEEGGDPESLELAVGAAMATAPATAAPSWAAASWSAPGALDRIGRAVTDAAIAPALPHRSASAADLDDRARGLAALAVALGRSVDGVQALAARLPAADGRLLLRMAGVAGARVAPGDPSRMRAWLKAELAAEPTDG